VQPKKAQNAPSPTPSSPSTSVANGQPAAPAAAAAAAAAAGEQAATPEAGALTAVASQEAERTNAIVVKNLPFQLKQEEFQEILNTFEPKAAHLKYHLDNGQFRGIAFIKYRTVEEATVIYDKFQSFEIGGRRIRCEFKRKQLASDLDLDDDEAKVLWEQLNRFKESSLLELPFPSSLSGLQRKQIHYFADRLGLLHYSQGEGETRLIVVTKRRERQPQGSNTVGLQPMDDKSWRARNQEEKKKAAAEPTLRIQPVRQPKGPEPSKGFSDEYRASRKLAPPPPAPTSAPVPAPTPAAAANSPVTPKLSASAPAFQPKVGSTPPVPHATVAATASTTGVEEKI